MTRKILVTVCWALLIGAAIGYAQDVHKMIVEIPHPFSVSGSQLAAGRYTFELSGQTHQAVMIRSADGKNSAQCMIATSISAPVSAPEQPRLVFDNIQGQYILSEVWMPGHDGFLISGFRGDSEHKHSTIKAFPGK